MESNEKRKVKRKLKKDSDVRAITFADVLEQERRVLKREEELEVVARAKAGDAEAKNQLVLCNLRLILQVTMQYSKNLAFNTNEDMFNDGVVGLLEAIPNFNPSLGMRFSTYVVPYIKHAVSESFRVNEHLVPLPKISNSNVKLIYDILEGMVVVTPEILKNDLKMSNEKLESVLRALRRPLQISEIDGTGGSSWNAVYDESTANVEKDAMLSVTIDDVCQEISNLNEREQYIVRSRYGVSNYKEKSRKELSHELGVSTESIRLIENSAIKKLKLVMREKYAIGNI